MIFESELADENDRLLLTAQRAANRDDWAAAYAAADEVLKNAPDRAEALFVAAQAVRRTGNTGVAAQLFNVLTKMEPKRPAVWLALGWCLTERRPWDAYKAARRAQELGPDEGDTLSLLCNLSSVLGRHTEALEWAERFEAIHGYVGEVSHNKSFALFALGRWAEAWKAFRASLGQPDRKPRNYHGGQETPRWNPAKHKDAVVAIYGEQGIGDEVMYASMIDRAIEAAEAKGSRVIIECYQRNAALFRGSFPKATVYGTLREPYAEWPVLEGVTHRLEMGGLGEFFAPEPFRRGAYLTPDPAYVQAFRAWFQEKGAKPLKVGIAWTGGSWATGRARRSIPFDDIMALMRGQDVTFVSLEYEDRAKDLEFAPAVLTHPVTAKGQDQAELAGLVANLDLVISVQTSVVDLAGALGVPVWAVTDEVPQWRYTGFWGDDTMGFYESAKVYRQERWGEWKPVVQRLARDLKAWSESGLAVAAA